MKRSMLAARRYRILRGSGGSASRCGVGSFPRASGASGRRDRGLGSLRTRAAAPYHENRTVEVRFSWQSVSEDELSFRGGRLSGGGSRRCGDRKNGAWESGDRCDGGGTVRQPLAVHAGRRRPGAAPGQSRVGPCTGPPARVNFGGVLRRLRGRSKAGRGGAGQQTARARRETGSTARQDAARRRPETTTMGDSQ